jgi:cell division protein ZapA
MDEYYETKKKVDQKKNELKDLSNKFRELKALIYDYREQKEEEIKQLNADHLNFKNEIEANHKKYEQLIDEAADEISNFIEKAKLENISQ